MDADGTRGDEALALESLLRWYAAMGVDAPLDEAPHDRFVVPEELAPPRSRDEASKPASDRTAPAAVALGAADDMIRDAGASAAAAMTLAELRERWDGLVGCGLRSTAARMVFADGNPHAKLMIVGGAPAADDERGGTAFSGAQGRLVDAMLAAIGLSRDSSYLTTIVPWRPPGNRAPTPLELALCLPFARRHIELVGPTCLLCMGERAAQPLLATRDPISRLRGRWLSFEGATRTVKTLVTFSPDFVLTQPLHKRRVWADLLMIEDELGG